MCGSFSSLCASSNTNVKQQDTANPPTAATPVAAARNNKYPSRQRTISQLITVLFHAILHGLRGPEERLSAAILCPCLRYQGGVAMITRRIVTGHTPDGRSIVVRDEEVSGIVLGPMGSSATLLWGRDGPGRFPDDGAAQPMASSFPPPGGCAIAATAWR
jgi:hypothetical protein